MAKGGSRCEISANSTVRRRCRRSLNGEVIACLERQLAPHVLSADERLARARKLRAAVASDELDPKEIAEAIRQGRA